jgi:hypothetical protein
MMRRIFILLLLVPLAACMSNRERSLRKSPDYRVGYQDGCNSADPPGANKREETAIVRDDAEYKTNAAYHAGWNKGLTACRASVSQNRGADPGSSPNAGPIPDINPGNGGLPRPY